MQRTSDAVLEGSAIPAALAAAHRAPRRLHLRGRLPDAEAPRLAIVGSRTPSPSGAWAAHAIARDLARAGVVVVSGLARGIDAAAHRGALDGGGVTVAFLGSGVDAIDQRPARELAEEIARSGALMSEYPPEEEARPWRFVQRNRLIAAYARGVLIVEAGARSGALITAGMAADLGKDLWAVPGDPRRPTCRGSNRLLRDGAGVVLEAQDLIAALGLARVPVGETGTPPPPPGLSDAETRIWTALGLRGDADPETLSRWTALPVAALLEALSLLELAGRVRSEAGRYVLAAGDGAGKSGRGGRGPSRPRPPSAQDQSS